MLKSLFLHFSLIMYSQVIEFMHNRRSVLIKHMHEPGPNKKQLQAILTIACRVPDHRKLEPWRFLVIQKNARKRLGEALALLKTEQQYLEPEQIEAEQQSLMRAPVVIAVIASPVEHKTPWAEQILSAGAVCQHINIAAAAHGFASQWITGWTFENKQAEQLLGLNDKEFVAGYLYIGSSDDQPVDRKRPDLSDKVTWLTD